MLLEKLSIHSIIDTFEFNGKNQKYPQKSKDQKYQKYQKDPKNKQKTKYQGTFRQGKMWCWEIE